MELLSKLKNGASPHIRTPRTTAQIMTEVLIALIFPTAGAVYFFGPEVILMIALGMGTSVLSEYLYQKWTYKKITIQDRSALVTGALLGLSLPVSAPWWSVVVGSVFAIVVVKQLGGGIGRNVFNPAVAARVMLKAFFSPWITNWVLPGPDAVSAATPLEYIGGGATSVPEMVPGLRDLFFGFNLGGNVGETSKALILLGMLYLIFRRIINPKIPVLYILTTTLLMGIFSYFDFEFMMSHALSGTLFFGATYMATDYSSGALTPEGKTVFAVGAGVLTALFRFFFTYPGGVGFAILIMNGLAPFIDQKFMPRIYGHKERPKVKWNRQ